MRNLWLNKNAFYNNTNKILSTFIIFMVIRRSLTPENRKRLLTKPHIKFIKGSHINPNNNVTSCFIIPNFV